MNTFDLIAIGFAVSIISFVLGWVFRKPKTKIIEKFTKIYEQVQIAEIGQNGVCSGWDYRQGKRVFTRPYPNGDVEVSKVYFYVQEIGVEGVELIFEKTENAKDATMPERVTDETGML